MTGVSDAGTTAAGPVRPRATIVIPTAGASGPAWGEERVYVVGCVESIERHSYEVDHGYVIVADDRGDLSYLDEVTALAPDRVRVILFDDAFHFSRKVNIGAAATDAEYLVILNDDIEATDPGWLDRMVAIAAAPDVGAVGAVLRYDDGSIQHAGHRYANGGPSHVHYRSDIPRDSGHEALRDRDVSGVTAACIVQRREVWREVGGLTPIFPVNYNDVDYCLKIRQLGLRIVLAGSVELVHFESKSRDPATTPEERARLRNRWSHMMQVDEFSP